ncbi:Polyprenol reductase-like Protein [Tribolium castaneum]|nr:Polyprenol reductase-like Protein [Tribolium castaneum]
MIRYGKLVNDAKERSAISWKNLEVPKSYFKYIYSVSAWVYVPIILYQVILVYFLEKNASQWFTALLDICCGSDRIAMVSTTHTVIAVFLMTLQIWRRFYDTHFVSVFSKKASMFCLQFIIGIFYYFIALVILLSEAPKFAVTRGEDKFNWSHVTITDAVAVLVFFWAWYRQHTTTVILANLRKNKKGAVVTENYKLPEGDLFKYLSSPHCTTEILMYLCLWVILGYQHSWWCVCTLVLSNQLDSIISTHKWYKKKFKNFPKERKALIPFVI